MDTKKRRCVCCNKKLDLTAFPCRCGGLYCPMHRGDTLHNCSYDYKADALKLLSTSMEKIVAKKIDII